MYVRGENINICEIHWEKMWEYKYNKQGKEQETWIKITKINNGQININTPLWHINILNTIRVEPNNKYVSNNAIPLCPTIYSRKEGFKTLNFI